MTDVTFTDDAAASAVAFIDAVFPGGTTTNTEINVLGNVPANFYGDGTQTGTKTTKNLSDALAVVTKLDFQSTTVGYIAFASATFGATTLSFPDLKITGVRAFESATFTALTTISFPDLATMGSMHFSLSPSHY